MSRAAGVVTDRDSLSNRTLRVLTLAMQLGLVAVFAVGYQRASVGIVVNAGVGLFVTFLPALLAWNSRLRLHPSLVFWITVAVLLHAVGTLGPYGQFWWWDVVAHALSASVVAAVGYTTARALDRFSTRLVLPPLFMFLYILLFVMAAGVVWELLEYSLPYLTQWIGIPPVLGQGDIDDTVTDLLFDFVGGLVVALFGGLTLTREVALFTAGLRGRSPR